MARSSRSRPCRRSAPSSRSDCHVLPTGSNHLVTNEFGSQEIETPELRHLREKLDFGLAGPQKRGFGVEHDGGRPLADFLASTRFTLSPQDERDVLAFVLALPGDVAPAVGHQTTLRPENRDDVAVRATLAVVEAQAEAGACDLVAHGRVGGTRVGFVYDATAGRWQPDDDGPALATDALLAALSAGDVVTITGVPSGAGRRLGVDRDRGTWLDGVEAARGLDPADPHRNPWEATPACETVMSAGPRLTLRDLSDDYGRQRLTLRATLAWPADIPFEPTVGGAQVLLEDLGAGGVLVDWTVPGSDPATGCGRRDGWGTSGAGRVVVYRSRSRVLPPACTAGANGLDRLRFVDRRGDGGGIDVTVTARRAGIPTPIGPLRVTVVAGETARAVVRGQCGTHAFEAPACAFGPGGRRLRCQ